MVFKYQRISLIFRFANSAATSFDVTIYGPNFEFIAEQHTQLIYFLDFETILQQNTNYYFKGSLCYSSHPK